jgi:TolB-like protein/Tfp pilus assembly protein PilF
LPFAAPADGDPRLLKLADGLTTSVTDALSISRIWTVLGRGTSFAFRDRPDAPRDLGREAGATFVAQGTLLQAADRLRASVELIDAHSGERVWSERFERPTSDWAAVEDELGARIGDALYRDAIRQAIRERAAQRPPDELAAHELALMADDQSELFTHEANARGLELTEHALARDPRSSFALFIRGRLFRQQVNEGFAPAGEAMTGWGEAVRKLVDIDPNYAWGHLDLGNWYAYSSKQDALVLAELDRALELAPNNPQILSQVAEQLPWTGQPEQAAELLDRAVRFDPRMRFNWRQYQVGFFLGRFREAVDLIEGFNDTSRWDHLFATLSYAQLGDAVRAADWRARLTESWPEFSWELSAAESGDFSPAAKEERALWVDSLAKAGLPLCATAEQMERLKINPLPDCQAERAKLAASRP